MALPDPREYCISTKEFILDEQGKLKGLNTGMSDTLLNHSVY